jgi:hypothetical protein
MLSCAGAYVFGAAGSNTCPAGSVRIEAEAACRTAAAAAGKTVLPSFLQNDPEYPKGCYTTSSNAAYFNTAAVGARCVLTQWLLCAAVTTGAPPHCSDARARAGARAAALRGCAAT